MISMEFWEWIEGKYVEWRGNTRATVKEYADWLGVSQPLLSQWMKKGGKVPKAKKQIDLLIARYPDDQKLYELLDVDKPSDPFVNLPPAFAKRARSAFVEIKAALEASGAALDSPEAEGITIRIMEKYGFKYQSTEEAD